LDSIDDSFAFVVVSADISFDSIVGSFDYITDSIDSIDDSFAYVTISDAISFDAIVDSFL
jgi:hypothetical protein